MDQTNKQGTDDTVTNPVRVPEIYDVQINHMSSNRSEQTGYPNKSVDYSKLITLDDTEFGKWLEPLEKTDQSAAAGLYLCRYPAVGITGNSYILVFWMLVYLKERKKLWKNKVNPKDN